MRGLREARYARIIAPATLPQEKSALSAMRPASWRRIPGPGPPNETRGTAREIRN
ncbi:MAG: hypothetical protein MUC66_05135 [Methanolinea sp.]|nr:hypothetical protein [Methanolinea sp.]